MKEKKEKAILLTQKYKESADYSQVDESFLSFLKDSVEKRVIPALNKIKHRKETGAQKARCLRID